MCGTHLVLLATLSILHSATAEYSTRNTYQVNRGHNVSTRKICDSEQIENRLTSLEVRVAQKDENIRSELRETNRRLQALEYRENELHRAVNGLREQFSKVTGLNQNIVQQDSSNEELTNKVDVISKGLIIFSNILTGISSEVTALKNNLSAISNTTSDILNQQHNLVSKQFLTTSLRDIRHQPNIVTSSSSLPKNCQDISAKENGIYLIQPTVAVAPFLVKCDFEKLGGGWTYIHNRFDGSQEFYNDYQEYKVGFGNIAGEFWLGLEKIHQLTGSELNELLIELEDFEGGKMYTHYSAFGIGPEGEGFNLKVLGGYSGTAGDSLVYHAGSKFSTKDLDQDSWHEGSCAKSHGGAWWYKSCDTSNLNGKYLSGNVHELFTYQGMYWGEFRGPQYSLKSAAMLIRPRSEQTA